MSAKGGLVCPPVYYDIPAKENAFMDTGVRLNMPLVNMPLALRQWTDPVNLLQMFGLSMRLMVPIKYRWDMVFTANGGWAHGKRALAANFLLPIRQPEKEHFWEWFTRLGFQVETGALRGIPTEPHYIAWEGQGDTLMGSRGHCFFGWGVRSDYEARPYIEDMLEPGEETVPLRLVGDFYHLDTCLTALRPRDTLIYYPPAFSLESQNLIESLPENRLLLSAYLANCFAANSIYLDDVLLLNVPFPASEESCLLSAHGEFLTESDTRFKELDRFDRGEWEKSPRLVRKLKEQGFEYPFRDGQDGLSVGYIWLIHKLWDWSMKVVPVYTSQFELSGAGARCCVMFLDWLPEGGPKVPNSMEGPKVPSAPVVSPSTLLSLGVNGPSK